MDANPERDAAPWWGGGLRFECMGCGRCCRGAPGGIFMLPDEERRIAAHVGVPVEELRRRFETTRWRFPSLRETSGGRCIMNDGNGRCGIYPCRPVECRTWPFWPELLASPEAWARAARRCPGMDCGALWSAEEIAAVLAEHADYAARLESEWRGAVHGRESVGTAD